MFADFDASICLDLGNFKVSTSLKSLLEYLLRLHPFKRE